MAVAIITNADGGSGTSTVEYTGNSTDYTITRNTDGTLTREPAHWCPSSKPVFSETG